MLNWLKCVGDAMGRSNAETRVTQGRRARDTRAARVDAFHPWDSAAEHLEPRMLLATGTGLMGPFPSEVHVPGQISGPQTYDITAVTWKGTTVQAVRGQWIVSFNSRNTREQAKLMGQQVAAALGVNALSIEPSPLGRSVVMRTNGTFNETDMAHAKQQFSFLRNIAPDTMIETELVPNDARYGEQWALNNTGQFAGNSGNGTAGSDIEAESAWNFTTGSRQVIVAVIDTGVDINHPDLRANIWQNPGEIPGNGVDDDLNGFVDDVNGWDFAGGQDGVTGDNNPQDPPAQGHGTAVAGTIGAVGNNGIGVAGTAWQISMIPIKIFPEVGGAPQSASNAAIEYVTVLREQGINIVASNNSWGSVSDADPDQFDDSEAIAIQGHTDAGVLFIAAAGNDSIDNDGGERAYPASYDNPDIISVAATDNKDLLADFSNFGATTVDVGAPGVQVLTTSNGGGYELIDGTSFASPYTTGVVAMMASLNRFADKTQLKTTLFASVDPIVALQGKVVTGGRINLFKALNAIGVPGPVVAAVNPGPQTAPVDTITVQFSKEMDDSFFDISMLRLQRANGDGIFNSNDLDITTSSPGVSIVGATLVGKILTISLSAQLVNDRYRLTLNDDGFRDLGGNYLNGNTGGGADEVYEFNVVIFRGPLEPNDEISEATPVVLNAAGIAVFEDLVIGDGVHQELDVDMFRLFANGPSLITITLNARDLPVPSELDTYVRLFDSNGVPLAANDNFNGLDAKLEYFVPAGGFFYVGVSAYANVLYQAPNAGSGIEGDTAGTYGVTFEVFTPGPESRTTTNNNVLPLPDVSVITSTINITDGRSIQDINILLNISHSFVSDLRVTLTSPAGGVFTLINRRGGAGDNINTRFDAEAGAPITGGAAPFTGTFRPESDLTTLYNTSAAGIWTLTIQDFKAGDFGTLNSWSLELSLVNNLFGPFELNDSTSIATATGIAGTGSRNFTAAIGDGAYGLRDVDLFRFVANSGTTIQAFTVVSGAQVDTVLRIFDAQGREVAIDRRKGSRAAQTSFVVVTGGVYYVGVSGGNTTNNLDFGNTAYDPFNAGTGTETDATGGYTLTISVTGGVGENNVILSGENISAGLNPNGTIGVTDSETPTGLKLGENDYLLLGALESYFGVIADGFIGRNAAGGTQSDLALSVNNESDYSNRRATASGFFRSLSVRRSLSFGVNDRVIAVDVVIRNVGLETINDVGWVEGFNANQGLNFEDGNAMTFNDVDATGRLATSSKNGMTLGIGAANTAYGEFASFENAGSVRDPFQVINSANDPNGAESNQGMALAFNLGTLAPDDSHTFRYFIFMGSASQVNTAFTALNNGTGTGHLVGDPNELSLDADELPYSLYYPEGFANKSNNTFIPMINGNDGSVRVVIIAHYEGNAGEDVLYDSATEVVGGLIGGHRRFGYTLTNPTLYAAGDETRVGSQFAGRDGVLKKTPYSIEIRSSLPIGATFSHYDFNISTGEAFTSQTSTVWTFGDASRSATESDFLLFYNPNNVPTKVTLTIYPQQGNASQQVLTSTFTVQAERRGGWNLKKFIGLTNGKYSLKLESDLPVVAALTHYDTGKNAGFATLGMPTIGSTNGSTGEGEYGTNATDEYIGILNAGSQASTVTLTLNYANGSAYRRTVVAPAAKRTTVAIASLPGVVPGQAFSISYEATQPVGVSLSSYSFGEATGSAFVNEAATQWLFGEGFRPANNNTRIKDYLRVFNPSSVDTQVAITLNYNTGETETFFQPVKARAANVFNLHDFVTGAHRNVQSFFSVKVQAAVPVVAFFGHFDTNLGGGFGSPGTPLGTRGLPS